jgi:hypothetical protein
MSEMQARLECLKIAQTLSTETDGVLAEAERLYGFVASKNVKSERTPLYHNNRYIKERSGRLYLLP